MNKSIRSYCTCAGDKRLAEPAHCSFVARQREQNLFLKICWLNGALGSSSKPDSYGHNLFFHSVTVCVFVCVCVCTHHTVEAVEWGVEVGLDAQTIHLDQHLGHEQSEEDKLCIDCREGGRKKRRRDGVKYRERWKKMKEWGRGDCERGEENQRKRK